MANKLRILRGDPRIITLPKYSADAIEMGDLLWWDATNNAVRNAEQVSGVDYATKQSNFAAAFVGVAMASADANTTGNIPVATGGDYVYDVPTGAEYDVADMVAIGDGTAVKDQTVVKTATAAASIGRVIAPKASATAYATIRIAPKINVA